MIMNKIKEKGQEKNTIIIFISDNGATVPGIGGADTKFFKSNGSLKGYKMDLYEGGIRVPCIVSWPGKIKPNTTNHSVIAAWDWMNTIVDLVGNETTESSDGISIRKPLFNNKIVLQDRPLYWEYYSGRVRALRLGDWKLIRFSPNGNSKGQIAHDELYNLNSDPGEQNNLAENR
jgi:arylsulfatase A-like enzyme